MSAVSENEVRKNEVLPKLALGGCALLTGAIFFWIASRGGLFWGSPRPHLELAPFAYGLVALLAAIGAWLEHRRRIQVYLAGSALLACLTLQTYAPIAFAYVALVIWLSRARLPLALRMTVVVTVWLAVPLSKLWLDRGIAHSMFGLFVFWSTLPFSGPYLLVERSRGMLQTSSVLDDAFYLLAPARFVTPFVQAISPAKLKASFTAAPTLKLAGQALGLAVYGAALQLVLKGLPFTPPGSTQPRPEWLHGIPIQSTNAVFAYAANAAGVFCGIAVLRTLGFNLGSGFNWPLLSRSLAEFFRRWNYYVFEGVMSLFLYPILARLRRWLPDRVALIVGTYLAIFFGSFILMNVLGPLATAGNPRQVFAHMSDLSVIAMYAVYWTGIIMPQTGIFDWLRPKGPPPLWRRIFQRAVFLIMVVLIIQQAFLRGVYVL